jgi:hypothetical protein
MLRRSVASREAPSSDLRMPRAPLRRHCLSASTQTARLNGVLVFGPISWGFETRLGGSERRPLPAHMGGSAKRGRSPLPERQADPTGPPVSKPAALRLRR